MNRVYLLTYLLLFTALTTFAQDAITYGTVKSSNGIGIEFATVRIVYSNGHTYGAVTDNNGEFKIECERGNAQIFVSRVGFTSYENEVTILEETKTLPDIVLEEADIELSGITITARKPLVRREVDRIVLDASQLSKMSVHALDLLRQTPGLIVSSDGSIQMIGKGSVIVMVNERQLKMTTRELITLLRTYRATDIESIEVMTTPPAKYAAEGQCWYRQHSSKEKTKRLLRWLTL